MSKNIINQQELENLLAICSGQQNESGNPRFKAIIQKLMADICNTIEQFDITDEEFWQAINYINVLGERKETALLAAGIGLERFLDMRADAKEQQQGLQTGTPRTIEGPLYVANAPLSEGYTRMDDGKDEGQPMWLHGQVTDTEGNPVANAIVDIWHANTLGNYSFFDSSQSEYNLRRRIKTGPDGKYSVRSIIPSGYGCPPDGPTQALLNQLGRHGNRPAHIHFFISGPGFKHLTSQINLNGDKYLWDDFAFATREGLVADPIEVTAKDIAQQRDMPSPHIEVKFDFQLVATIDREQENRIKRLRALE